MAGSVRSARPERSAQAVSHLLAVGCSAVLLAGVVTVSRVLDGSNPPSSVLIVVTVALVYLYGTVRTRTQRWLEARFATDGSRDAVLGRLADSVERFNHPESALEQAALVLADATGATSVAIALWIDDALETVVTAPARADAPSIVPSRDSSAGMAPIQSGNVVVTPMSVAGDPVGVLTADLGRAPRARDIAVLADVGVTLGVLARSAGLRRTIRRRIALAERRGVELAEARTRLARVQLRERRRIERDLHDVCQQRAVVLGGRLGSLVDGSVHDPAEVASVVRDAIGDVDRIERSIADVLRNAGGHLLADGISSALLADAADLPLPVDVIDGLPRRYPPAVEEQVYACCLEAVTNAIKHSGARHIEVRLAGTAAELRFAVVDDGRGFDVAGARSSGGLGNLTARLAALGGELQVRSDESGTRLSGWIPL